MKPEVYLFIGAALIALGIVFSSPLAGLSSLVFFLCGFGKAARRYSDAALDAYTETEFDDEVDGELLSLFELKVIK